MHCSFQPFVLYLKGKLEIYIDILKQFPQRKSEFGYKDIFQIFQMYNERSMNHFTLN